MTIGRRIALPLLFAATLTACRSGGPTAGGPQGRRARELPPSRVKQVETAPMAIEGIYTSMTGPFDRVDVDTSDVGWITGFSSEVVDAASGERMGAEFFCHSQLQFAWGHRLTVNATGIEAVRFPPGFGIHVGGDPADEEHKLQLFGMLLNNHVPDMHQRAKVRATIEYLTEEEAGSPPALKELYPMHLSVSAEDAAVVSAPGAAPAAGDPAAGHCATVDGDGRHWIVPPGTQRMRNRFPTIVPFDSRVHFAAAHLHNHGEYLRLTDATTGEVVWQSDVEYEPDRRQILRIPYYASSEGFPLYADRVYEIEAFYNNTSDRPTDAMAMLYLYLATVGGEQLLFVPTPPPAAAGAG